MTIIQAVFNFIFDVYIFLIVLDGWQNGDGFWNICRKVGLICLAQIVFLAARNWYESCYVPQSNLRTSQYMRKLVSGKMKEIDLLCYDAPEFYDGYIRAMNDVEGRSDAFLASMNSFVNNLFAIFSTSFVIFTIDPAFLAIALIPLFVSFFIGKAQGKARFACRMETQANEREEAYIRRIFYSKEYAEEMRTTGIARVLIRHFGDIMEGFQRIVRKHRWALRDISSRIDPREKIAIVGYNGAGKTTLVRLIMRLYEPTEGQVLGGGADVRDYKLRDLRGRVSIALQKSELFRGTIADNIAMGREGAAEADLASAAKTAQAMEFIRQKEGGFDAQVAERGMSLSGGQKQRVAISRAVLKEADILILDDATSALDLKTEADFYAALREQSPGMTKIVIAQRVASVKGADRIAILEGGTIIACAPHEELLRTCEVYRDIYNSQMKGAEQYA